MIREMSSRLFVTLYTLSINPSTHKQLRRHLPNPIREFPFSRSEASEATLVVLLLVIGGSRGPVSSRFPSLNLYNFHLQAIPIVVTEVQSIITFSKEY